MKVHLIKKQTIEDFVSENVQSRLPFEGWLFTLKMADWATLLDIISTFRTADILGNGSDRVVFNIGGNNYRMICRYLFGTKQIHLFICWIGTHAEYTALCKNNRQYDINKY